MVYSVVMVKENKHSGGGKVESYYSKVIGEEIARQGKIGIDPRHVEAYMRLEHSTLDGLSKGQFKQEVTIGILCVEEAGTAQAESCAKSFAL